MNHLRHRLSYANVMATVAVFLALGGGAYAAAKITGRDVVNRSLTGKDIKKRSVPLNRLKGRPRTGPQGAQGAQGVKGDTGPPGPVDPSRFLPSDGVTTVGVGPTSWTIATAANALTRSRVERDRVEFSTNAAAVTQFLILEPTLSVSLAGASTRLTAMTLCVNAADPSATLSAVFVSQNRGPLANGGGRSTVVAEFSDEIDRDDSVCRRYPLPAPFVLAPNDHINVGLRFNFSAAGEVYVGASSFELDRPA